MACIIALAATMVYNLCDVGTIKHILKSTSGNPRSRTCRDAGFVPPVICDSDKLKATK